MSRSRISCRRSLPGVASAVIRYRSGRPARMAATVSTDQGTTLREIGCGCDTDLAEHGFFTIRPSSTAAVRIALKWVEGK